MVTHFSIWIMPSYIYIYIYIVIHRQTCIVLSELFSVARQARFPKLGSNRQSKTLPLSHKETSASEGNLNAYLSHLFLFYIYSLNGYQELDSYIYIYIYIYMYTYAWERLEIVLSLYPYLYCCQISLILSLWIIGRVAEILILSFAMSKHLPREKNRYYSLTQPEGQRMKILSRNDKVG